MVEDEQDSEEEEDELDEEEEEISSEEVKDTFLNSAQVVGDKDTLLFTSHKVLRHGKEIQGEGMDQLTDKIKELMQTEGEVL